MLALVIFVTDAELKNRSMILPNISVRESNCSLTGAFMNHAFELLRWTHLLPGWKKGRAREIHRTSPKKRQPKQRRMCTLTQSIHWKKDTWRQTKHSHGERSYPWGRAGLPHPPAYLSNSSDNFQPSWRDPAVRQSGLTGEAGGAWAPSSTALSPGSKRKPGSSFAHTHRWREIRGGEAPSHMPGLRLQETELVIAPSLESSL